MKAIDSILKTWNSVETKNKICIEQFRDFYFKRFLQPKYWFSEETWKKYIINDKGSYNDNIFTAINLERGTLNLGASITPSLTAIRMSEDYKTYSLKYIFANAIENTLDYLKQTTVSSGFLIHNAKNFYQDLLYYWQKLHLNIPKDPFVEAIQNNLNILNSLQEYKIREDGKYEYYSIEERYLKKLYTDLRKAWQEVYVKVYGDEVSIAANRNCIIEAFWGKFSNTLNNNLNNLKSKVQDALQNIVDDVEAKENSEGYKNIFNVSSNVLKAYINRVLDVYKNFNDTTTDLGYDVTENINNYIEDYVDTFDKALKEIIDSLSDYGNKDTPAEKRIYTSKEKAKIIFNTLNGGWEGTIHGETNNLIDVLNGGWEGIYKQFGKYGYYLSEENNNQLILECARMPKFKPVVQEAGLFGMDTEYDINKGLLGSINSLKEKLKNGYIDKHEIDEYINKYWYSVQESNRLAQSFIIQTIFDRVGMTVDLNVPVQHEDQSTDLTTYANTVMDISGIPAHILDPGIYTRDKNNKREVPKTLVKSVNDLYTIKATGPDYEPKEYDILPEQGSNKPVLSSGIYNYIWKRISWYEGFQEQDKVCCIRFPYQSYPYHAVIATQGEVVHIELNQSCNGRELTKNAQFESKFLRTDDYIYLYFKTTVGKYTLTVFGIDSDKLRLSSVEDYPVGTVMTNLVF